MKAVNCDGRCRTVEDLDKNLMKGFGMLMGPFALADTNRLIVLK
jgi:3-hydroxyacyl-CoA dehydrogenase